MYLYLKSSDFVAHDLTPAMVFDGCSDNSSELESEGSWGYGLELVLKKWYSMDQSREIRCFVRDEVLLGEPARARSWFFLLNDETL